MSHEFQQLESDLRALRPAALDPSLAARLAGLASLTATAPDAATTALETALARLHPLPLPADLSAAILAATSAAETTVLPFPNAPPIVHGAWGRYMLPIAAAVALLGAAAALLVPTTRPADSTLADRRPAAPATPAEVQPGLAGNPGPSNFAAAGFRTDLSQTSDEGVVWNSPNQPHRVVKVIYRDRVTFVDQNGRKYEVERPRVEYILVPEKLD